MNCHIKENLRPAELGEKTENFIESESIIYFDATLYLWSMLDSELIYPGMELYTFLLKEWIFPFRKKSNTELLYEEVWFWE